MSDDQKTGYLLFTNDQYDWILQMCSILSKREMAVLLAIIRFTFGFRRKEARLSASYLHKACGVRASHVPETLQKLCDRQIINVLPRAEKNTNTIRFDWVKVMKSDTPKTGEVDTPESGEVTLPKRERKTSQIGSKLTPESGEKTIKKTTKKDNTEDTELDVVCDFDDGVFR